MFCFLIVYYKYSRGWQSICVFDLFRPSIVAKHPVEHRDMVIGDQQH